MCVYECVALYQCLCECVFNLLSLLVCVSVLMCLWYVCVSVRVGRF